MSLFRKLFFYWLPVFLWVGVIFYLSSQSYQQQDLRPMLHKNIPEQTIVSHFSNVDIHYGGHEVSIKQSGVPGFTEFFIRKGAHLTVYFILGLLVVRAFLSTNVIRIMAIPISLCLCFLYAASDEVHQIFSAGRTPMFQDVILDSCGSFIAIILGYFLFTKLKRKMAVKVNA